MRYTALLDQSVGEVQFMAREFESNFKCNLTNRNYREELNGFLLKESDVEKVLDAIELSFKLIDRFTRDYDYRLRNDASEAADVSIKELNIRFREHGIGFQYLEGEIFRVDSELLHAETVIPVLRLLSEEGFAGAQEEFLSAHEHYRHGNHKEAINDCLKAFESTMKVICGKHGWTLNPNSTAKTLIQCCFDNGLVPPFWQQQLSSLRSMLER